jgi:hypothetical protein
VRSADSLLRLRTPARVALAATIAALVASGIGWLGAHYAPNVDDLLRLAIEAWMLKLHGAAAFAMLFAVGAMSAHHVRRGWLLARNRGSGIVVIAIVAILIATGYALYYVVTDATRPSISIVHWIAGLALAPILIVHLTIGRRAIARGNGHRSRIKRKAAAHPSAR